MIPHVSGPAVALRPQCLYYSHSVSNNTVMMLMLVAVVFYVVVVAVVVVVVFGLLYIPKTVSEMFCSRCSKYFEKFEWSALITPA